MERRFADGAASRAGRGLPAVFVAAAVLAASVPTAQAQVGPLKPAEVTVERITDALAPDAAGPRGRGFAPANKAESGRQRPASAAVLITFVTDSSELTAESRAALDVVARAMRGDALAGKSFVVEGHADRRGGDEYNLELSRARAESVVAYLVRDHGIARERLVPVGKGSGEPLNRTRANAQENRRVTFIARPN